MDSRESQHSDGRSDAGVEGVPVIEMTHDTTAAADQLGLGAEALARAIEAAPDGILVADGDGRIVFVNPMITTMFGYDEAELVGRSVEMLLPEAARNAHVAHRVGYAEEPKTRGMGAGLDLRGRHKRGDEFPVEISLSPVDGAHGRRVVAIVRDVTERRRATDELIRAREDLALVEDRERIARDLHDSVIQRLFAIGLSLQGSIPRATSKDLADRLDASIDEIDSAIRDIRTTIFSLHSRRAPKGGAREGILAIAQEAARALGYEPQVQFDGLIDASLPDAVYDQLVPTLREALANVAKHARASRVTVGITVGDDQCSLCVVDNGVGFGGAGNGGHGVANMAERAVALGGKCEVSSGSEGGTVVEWCVPLR